MSFKLEERLAETELDDSNHSGSKISQLESGTTELVALTNKN